jgi:ketosteroid isomerase-like protein
MTERPSAQEISDPTSDVRRIEELFNALQAAALAHDAAAFNSRYTSDVTFTVGDGRRSPPCPSARARRSASPA